MRHVSNSNAFYVFEIKSGIRKRKRDETLNKILLRYVRSMGENKAKNIFDDRMEENTKATQENLREKEPLLEIFQRKLLLLP